MSNNPPVPIQTTPQKSKENVQNLGCGTLVLVFFLVIWVASFSGLDLFVRWSIEQTLYETEVGVSDSRWLVHLAYCVMLLLPLVPIYLAMDSPRIKNVLRLWLTGAVFSMLTVPIKNFYLTSQNAAYWLLGLISLFSAIGLLLLSKKYKTQGIKTRSSTLTLKGVIGLASVALATPWILWGALGSVFDLVSAAFLGISFGFFAAISTITYYSYRDNLIDQSFNRGGFLLDGLVIAIFLLITVTGLSQNGSELLLVLSVPVAAWLIAALAIAAGQNVRNKLVGIGLIPGLLVFLPLAFFDMDELSLIISGTTGEVLYWTNRAAVSTLITLIAAGLFALIFFKQLAKLNWTKTLNFVVVGLCIVEVGVLYVFPGTPGFFGDRLFVVMKDQVSGAAVDGTYSLTERKHELYSLLVETANTDQRSLRQQLDRWGIKFTPYYLVNSLETNASGPLVRALLSRASSVDRVLESPRLRPLPQEVAINKGELTQPQEGTDWNLEMIRVQRVHNELGVKGEGILIGQTDSGVDGQHPELVNSYRGLNSTNDYHWLDPWNQSIAPIDIGGHGTGTTSIILGQSIGIAPEAEWIGCVNLARNLGNPALYLDCMQFMFAPYPQGMDPFTAGDTDQAAMIINNSWGCPRVEGCDPMLFENVMSVFRQAGVFVSVAAGNNGYYGCSTVTDPLAIYADVFTAGSVDKLGQLSAFSSRGPVVVDGSKRVKPDLLAPGEQVTVAAPGGTYTISSGTSFSAPHVSGVVALMWSANPELIGDIETTTRILLETAQPYIGQDPGCGRLENAAGAGILDAYAAVFRAKALK